MNFATIKNPLEWLEYWVKNLKKRVTVLENQGGSGVSISGVSPISVDNTDPTAPVISYTGGSSTPTTLTWEQFQTLNTSGWATNQWYQLGGSSTPLGTDYELHFQTDAFSILIPTCLLIDSSNRIFKAVLNCSNDLTMYVNESNLIKQMFEPTRELTVWNPFDGSTDNKLAFINAILSDDGTNYQNIEIGSGAIIHLDTWNTHPYPIKNWKFNAGEFNLKDRISLLNGETLPSVWTFTFDNYSLSDVTTYQNGTFGARGATGEIKEAININGESIFDNGYNASLICAKLSLTNVLNDTIEKIYNNDDNGDFIGHEMILSFGTNTRIIINVDYIFANAENYIIKKDNLDVVSYIKFRFGGSHPSWNRLLSCDPLYVVNPITQGLDVYTVANTDKFIVATEVDPAGHIIYDIGFSCNEYPGHEFTVKVEGTFTDFIITPYSGDTINRTTDINFGFGESNIITLISDGVSNWIVKQRGTV